MSLHSKQFTKHDKSRFKAYLQDVADGKSTIKGSQMLPHELVEKCCKPKADKDEVVELQWKVLIEEARKMGKLTGSLVVSDVSGSMAGVPMMVSIALGLLISEVTAAPFTNCVITFQEKPTFHIVTGSTFHQRVMNLKSAKWGGNTNFQAVFKLILDRACENRVPAEDMPRKLFVISDMQFDKAGGSKYETNHEAVKQQYQEAGYQMPQIIYWNVAGDRMEFPTTKDDLGVAMVSGFSPSILKFLLKGELLTPFGVLRSIIDNTRYSILEL